MHVPFAGHICTNYLLKNDKTKRNSQRRLNLTQNIFIRMSYLSYLKRAKRRIRQIIIHTSFETQLSYIVSVGALFCALLCVLLCALLCALLCTLLCALLCTSVKRNMVWYRKHVIQRPKLHRCLPFVYKYNITSVFNQRVIYTLKLTEV